MTLFLTAVTDRHVHTWMKGNQCTSFEDGHRHMIRGVNAVPVVRGRHSHLLLNIPANKMRVSLGR